MVGLIMIIWVSENGADTKKATEIGIMWVKQGYHKPSPIIQFGYSSRRYVYHSQVGL